ncbi:MAG: hypothetical protein EOP28_00485 [Rhodococcus sp. (in: high G+C Gram-positive bacteria)]|nr:MAG: hypothetical protein EOP28_00485 [Rhodococcus sp. (in: high G+C Gram-positive bacteria)]
MSNDITLQIRTKDITAVLLADGWHEVSEGSFDLAPYEFIQPTWTPTEGEEGFIKGEKVTVGSLTGVIGFQFTPRDAVTSISGPVTSILAFREY